MASVPGKAAGNCRRLQGSCVFLFTEADTAPFNMEVLFAVLATGKGLLSCGFLFCLKIFWLREKQSGGRFLKHLLLTAGKAA